MQVKEGAFQRKSHVFQKPDTFCDMEKGVCYNHTMKKNQRPYLKQKIDLYFDENFPAEIISDLKSDKSLKSRCRIYSVYDFGNQNKDDLFQFEFCERKGFTLVTLDTDFMNDIKYPFGGNSSGGVGNAAKIGR